jgi:hypothetical protein
MAFLLFIVIPTYGMFQIITTVPDGFMQYVGQGEVSSRVLALKGRYLCPDLYNTTDQHIQFCQPLPGILAASPAGRDQLFGRET